MTQRKPPQVTFPGWVEHQIRTAERAGAFEDLAGKGEAVPDLGRPRDELTWVANYLRRENVDTALLLPPALALAKEVETLPQRLREQRSETVARAMIEDLNARIREAHRLPQDGPPIRVWIVDVDRALARRRAELPPSAPVQPVAPAVAPLPRRRFWRR